MRQHVAKFRAKGYLGHSVKLDGVPKKDAERIAASLADKEPGEFFIVDANGGLTVETALRPREHLSLRRRTNVPIFFDELATDGASIAKLIADDAAEGIDLKISKAGGLTRARRQRDICLAAGYTIGVQDTVGSDIAFAAIVHMAQTIPERHLRCILESRDMVALKTADGDYQVHNGRITAPTTPGLGITPRLDVLGEAVATYT
ncbi:hypothetical protein HRR76_000870 [Exophiala dermatitidis]|nr:hypothetical protein HRR74_006465 [Exophiala dermatitidis]KAJ4542574.1 hypothetical protein HRR77_005771 [Exophiala dermatitidis]KAJ4548266.1 hypothetical protein HRR76_000870 [Exophiala dermatitidis]KAJ4654504.1 hypothetical protein HRR91_003996 [Exophiala dermatitidis]KAJ4670516.1 hypothetical protein HRR92_006479 [Exophiala dermatitidis]